MSHYEKEFEKSDKFSKAPRKIQNYLRRELGATKIGGKWQTCPKFKSNALYGSIFALSGCVIFWNLRCHKLVRQINEEYDIMTPDHLNKVAWAVNGVLKGIGLGLAIKSLIDYSRCK